MELFKKLSWFSLMANVDDVVDIVVDNVVVNDSNVVEVAFNGHKGELVVVVVGVVAVVFFVDVDVNDDNDGDDVAIKFNVVEFVDVSLFV